jgi:hypothetical protein
MHARTPWLCCLAGTIAFGSSASAHDPSPKWTPWVEFGGFYGSDDSSRGEAVLWVPFAQGNTSLLFGEARGKLFEDDMREGNVALGYRQMMPGGWNLGLWGGYDIRESEYGTTFHQLAGGIEALSDRWDLRANAYLPLNDSEAVLSASSFALTSSIVDFTGTSIGLITTGVTTTAVLEELALRGFDAEIGTKLYETPDDLLGPRHELRVYAGAYHFDHSDLPDSVTGPRLRAEWRMDEVVDQWQGSRLTLEAEYSHDDLRDDRFEVGARLRLPFGPEGRPAYASRPLTTQERRMADGLERVTDIVTDTKTTTSSTTSTINESAEDAITGTHLDQVVTIDNSQDLETVSSIAGDNTLIVVDGSSGAFVVGWTFLSGNQTILGGGQDLLLRGRSSGRLATFTAGGSVPTLADGTVYLNDPNTHLSGMHIDNQAHDDTLVMANATNSALTNLTLRSSAATAFAINVNAQTILQNLSLNAMSGVAFNLGTYSAILADSDITATHTGILIWTPGPITGTGNTVSAPTVCISFGSPWLGSLEINGTSYSDGSGC